MATKLHGQDYIPPDLYAKFTGQAKYAEDFRADGMLFAKLLLSPMPHCRVRNIDVSAALAMPGVEGIITAEDVPGSDDPFNEVALTNEPLYEGQPILAVAAVDELTAANAIEKIKLDLEPLPFVLDPLESLRPGSPNARVGGNILKRERTDDGVVQSAVELKWTADDWLAAGPDMMPMGEPEDEWAYGDIDAGFAEADSIIEETLYHQSATHHPMEPRTCFAYWRGEKLFIHPSTQSVQRTHPAVAGMLNMKPEDVVLVCKFTGGGFGSKIAGTVNMTIAALLAKKTGRPVMQRVTRYEETYYGRARPGFHGRIKLGMRKDGTISAIDMYLVQDNGPYGKQSDLFTAGNIASLSYQPTNIRFRGVSVFTNTPPRSAQRAPGGSQITSMLEPMIDRAANELGLDRWEVRRVNAPNGASKFGPRQQELTSAKVEEALVKARELVKWDEIKGRSGQRNGSKATGFGWSVSSYVAGTSGWDGLLYISTDGKLHIHTGVGNLGTHSYADTARVACDVLDFPWEKTEVVWGDTSQGLPHTAVQAGSMTTFSTTRAISAAAEDARRKLQEIAAKDLGGRPDDYTVGGERVYRKGNRSQGMSFARAAERAIALAGPYSGFEFADNLNGMTVVAAKSLAGKGLIGVAKDTYPHEGNVYSFVVGFAEVEVDLETGDRRLVDYAGVADCGTVMNPRSLRAQVLGGMIQGVGMAMGQKWVYDPKWGVPFAHRFYTARPPTMLDIPLDPKTAFVDEADPQTPIGSKGIGEPPVGAGQAAVACAIQDALGGAVFRRTPIMTDNIIDELDGNHQRVDSTRAHA